MTFNLSAFKPVTVRGVKLSVNDRLEVNGTLGVGGLEETIEVSAATQFVQPSPAVQTLMGPTQVQELPLNNRNFVQLATLVPGVSSDLGDEVGVGLTSTVSMSIDGGRRNSVNWLLDGVSNVDVGSNITLLSTPTLESIQEFKIITSSYSAEWPRSGGGVINVVTKRGIEVHRQCLRVLARRHAERELFFRKRSTDPEINAHPAASTTTTSAPRSAGRCSRPVRRPSSSSRRSGAGSPGCRSRTPATVVNPAWLSDPTNANYVAPRDRDPNAVRLLGSGRRQYGTEGYRHLRGPTNNTRQ